jgi:putative transposase
MKLVAAVKMKPTRGQATDLKATLARCNKAANWLAQIGHGTKTFRHYDLHKMAYVEIRTRFGLTAQAAVRTISKVADAFKVNREVAPVFRADAAQPYDDRIIRFIKDGSSVSIWTLEGRIVVPIVIGEHQKRLMAFRKGEVDLCLVRSRWILVTTCDIPETTEFNAEDWLGIGLGILSPVGDTVHDPAISSTTLQCGLVAPHR